VNTQFEIQVETASESHNFRDLCAVEVALVGGGDIVVGSF
jgi:hypothetical protein